MLLGNFLLPLLSKLSENRLHLSNSSELDCIRFALSLQSKPEGYNGLNGRNHFSINQSGVRVL